MSFPVLPLILSCLINLLLTFPGITLHFCRLNFIELTLKQCQSPEFRRLALFAGNELRFCRSCSGRQENFLRALDTPAPVPAGQQSVYAGIQQFSQLVQEDEVWAGEPTFPFGDRLWCHAHTRGNTVLRQSLSAASFGDANPDLLRINQSIITAPCLHAAGT